MEIWLFCWRKWVLVKSYQCIEGNQPRAGWPVPATPFDAQSKVTGVSALPRPHGETDSQGEATCRGQLGAKRQHRTTNLNLTFLLPAHTPSMGPPRPPGDSPTSQQGIQGLHRVWPQKSPLLQILLFSQINCLQFLEYALFPMPIVNSYSSFKASASVSWYLLLAQP